MVSRLRLSSSLGAVLALCAALASVESCSSFDDEPIAGVDASAIEAGDDRASPADAEPEDASADASDDATRCRGDSGPTSVAIPGATYCIDSTEVTGRDYKRFLSSIADTDGGVVWSTACGWKTSPTGVVGGGAIAGENEPVRNVDWCDAWAYCAWAGKRLCGDRSKGGGTLNVLSADDPLVGEWVNACTRGGERAYPYGEVFGPDRCQYQGGVIGDTGKLLTCQGGYDGVFDMSGNVREWEAACEATDASPVGLACLQRGGAAGDPTGNFRCKDLSQRFPIDYRAINYGIRCCADLR